MTQTKLVLSLLPGHLAICRLRAEADIPAWAQTGSFTSITRTTEELSIVCTQDKVPEGTRCEVGYRCFRVEGPLDFALTGILASLTTVLAQEGVSVFAVSTFDTDYLLVKEEQLEKTIGALSEAGHHVNQLRAGSRHKPLCH
jgi:hypothetical protein